MVVQQGELLASPPDRVRTWLEQRAADASSLRWSDNEALERALLERNDPLINLALARFGSDPDVLQALLAGVGRHDKVIRLAALINEVAGQAAFGRMPGSLLGHQTIEAFLSDLDREEIAALFSNRTLSNGFLTSFFEQETPWQALDDERRMAAIVTLTNNPRIAAKYEGPMDGSAEYSHGKVFAAAWELSGKVPVTVEWAQCLCWLYERLSPEAFSIKKPLELAARWVPTDAERVKDESADIERGDLGPFARTRKGIARLSVRAAYSKEARQLLATHEDPGIRAALYFEGALSVEDMKAAGERDLMLSFHEMMWNPRVWRTKAQREQLHAMAWDKRRDPKNYLDPQNVYNARLEYFQREHPDWFKDEEQEENANPDKQPAASEASSSGLEEVKGGVLTGNDLARATHLALVKVLHRTAWIGWGIAAVLALLLLRSR